MVPVPLMQFLMPVLTALAVALLATPAVRAIALRFGMMDIPNARSSHAAPTPRGGGIAILAGFTAAAIAFGAFHDRALAAAIAPAAAVALLSFADDVRHLPAWPKFAVHVVAASAALWAADLGLHRIDLPFITISLGAAAMAAAVVWTVGWINIYNFMDGVNGIASVQAIVAGTALAVLLARAGDAPGTILAAALAGAAAGFLPWNFPGARIFMGDVGSASIGFVFGVLTLRASIRVGIVAAALPLFPFLFDATVAIVRRAARGERFFSTAHKTHFYQRLKQITDSHAVVTLTWGGLAVLSSVGALIYGNVSATAKLAVLLMVLAIHVVVALLIARRGNAAAP